MTVLRYYDRCWSESDFEITLDAAGNNDGWHLIRQMGGDEPGLGISLLIFGHPPGHKMKEGEPRYLADYGIGGLCQEIIIPREQDLIDFLAHVSPTMLLATLPEDGSAVLDDLCEQAPWRVKRRDEAFRQSRKRAIEGSE